MRGRVTKKTHADYILLAYFAALLLFGLLMLTSASSVIAYDRFGDAYHFVKRQMLFGVLPGTLGFLFFSKIPYPLLKKFGNIIFYGTTALLIAVLIPGVGSTFDTGARSWIALGGFSFQPAEVAKFGLVFYMAYYLSAIGDKLQQVKEGFIPALIMGMIPIGLVILQPDIGTASILFAVLFVILFGAHARARDLVALAGVAVAAFLLLIAVAPYRAARFTTFLHPELDPQGIGYHINQAYLAIGSGGWIGYGLGHSRQKFQYLPEVHADSIFAVLAEELGFVVTVGFLVFLVLIARRMLRLAKHAPDDYGRLLVMGITAWFMVQSLFNIAAMVGLMPITGVPLPFVSHGGTALLIAMSAVGVLANVSKEADV